MDLTSLSVYYSSWVDSRVDSSRVDSKIKLNKFRELRMFTFREVPKSSQMTSKSVPVDFFSSSLCSNVQGCFFTFGANRSLLHVHDRLDEVLRNAQRGLLRSNEVPGIRVVPHLGSQLGG